MKSMRRFVHDHSLMLVTLALFVAMTGVALRTGYDVWKAEKLSIPFWRWFAFEYHMSLVADVFGGMYLVYATKRLRERGSPESGDEE